MRLTKEEQKEFDTICFLVYSLEAMLNNSIICGITPEEIDFAKKELSNHQDRFINFQLKHNSKYNIPKRKSERI